MFILLFSIPLLIVLAADPAPDTSYVEVPIGCAKYETGYTCPSAKICDSNCLSCTDNPFNCNMCKQGYFLFSLPQDQSDMGLKAGAKVCVQCPYQTYQDDYTIYCGDCLENGQGWDYSRKCTYDYFIKNLDKTNGAYHKVQKPLEVLFYVVPINKVLNPTTTEYFQTIVCEGCDKFCTAMSQVCFTVASQYQYDLNNKYVQCANGYVFNEAIQGCDSCPSNCQSCNIYLNRKLDSQGRVSYNIQKECLICNTGFSLYNGYPKVTSSPDPSASLEIWCEPCFSGCQECYFGNEVINLNSEPWKSNSANYIVPAGKTWTEQLAYLLLYYKIAQRCTVCTNPPNEPYIPSLDLRTCVRCDAQCSSCEYTTYDATITNEKLKFPTRNVYPVEPAKASNGQFNPTQADYDALNLKYRIRCRLCENPDYMFLAAGNDCAQCTISNCKICHKINDPTQGGSPFTSFANDFTPLDRESMSTEDCLQCADQYYLKYDSGTKLNSCVKVSDPASTSTNIPANKVLRACLNYALVGSDYQCRLCENGNKLYLDSSDSIWKCASTCQVDLKDFFCQSCVLVGTLLRCQMCADGFYVDMKTGKCSQCQSNGYCNSCVQYSRKSVYRPLYYLAQYDGDTTTLGPVCYTCANAAVQSLNPYSKKCEQCGDECALCMTNAPVGYCGQCKATTAPAPAVTSRSVTSDGTNCASCPEYSVGCRDRTAAEMESSNKYFVSSATYSKYSKQVFKCHDGADATHPIYYDAITGRCKKCSTYKKCEKSISVNVEAFCSTADTSTNPYIQIPTFFTDKTQKQASILMTSVDHNNNYLAWNSAGVTKVTINLIFQYKADATKNRCLFEKDTYITTNIKKNVFSVQELELKISVNGAPTNEKMQLFISGNLYLEYFTSVSIQGVQILPGIDMVYVSKSPNPYLQQQAFSLILTKNQGAKLFMTDVDILNFEARQYYLGLDTSHGTYTLPNSTQAQQLKKYTPFNTILLNVYDMQLTNVLFGSLNYLLSSDLPFQAFPLYLTYDSPIPYLNIKFTNVKFEDVCVGDQALIDLKSLTMTSLPEWNTKIIMQQVSMKNVYFADKGGFLSTKVTDKAQGMIIIDQMSIDKGYYNSSRGIVDFQTMQSISVKNFQLSNSYVNNTSLFKITTIEVNILLVSNTEFTFQGKLIETQFTAPIIKLNDFDNSGLKVTLYNMDFDKVACKTIACLILIQSPDNDYELKMNVTAYGITVSNVITTGFDEALVEAATSAAIQISKVYQLRLDEFNSINNPDITIFYSEQSQIVNFTKVTCSQTPKNNAIRNNYCVFINNFYRSVSLKQINLLNLNGIDNSFIAVVSWSNLVYNTSASGTDEQVFLDQVYVTECTITSTVLAVPSGAIIVDSTQAQKVNASNMLFHNNYHKQTLKGTLVPSNPTFLMKSIIGTLILFDSQWKNNYVSGFGAVVYIESGTQYLYNLSMINSNHDPLHLNSSDASYVPINSLAEGGHALLQGYNITLLNSTFTNSSAKVGGGIYVRALKEGLGYFKNISITYALTPLDGSVVSRGGCLYLDTLASAMNMTFDSIRFQDCSVRADGGGIYVITSDLSQYLTISNSIIQNCYGLAGSSIGIYYESRTTKTQLTTLNNVHIQGNYTNALSYFASLNNLTTIEQFLFIKRYAAFQQDYGQVKLSNSLSEGLYFFSYISLKSPTFLQISDIENQHSILSFRPYIEVIEPLTNPILIEAMQFRNISSLNSSISCNKTTKSIEETALCSILQIRVNFGEVIINPAMMLIDQITKYTPITINNIFLNRVICKECQQGLVQIMRVSNTVLQQLVNLGVSRCSNCESSYYGCYVISSESINSILDTDKYLNYTYSTNLSSTQIKSTTGLSGRLAQQQLINNQTSNRLLQTTTTTTNTTNYQYAVPTPSYLSHVVIKGMNVQEMTAVHGGGVTIFGLTANVTEMYCTLMNVTGEGGCIFYESIPKKNGSQVFQRLNVVNSVFFRNNASIGGAIRVRESGISDPSKNGNTLVQNHALLFGDDVAGYPTKMAIKLSGTIQLQSLLNDNTGWLHYPLVVKSGQVMKAFESQDVILILLDEENNQMNYQFETTALMSSSQTNTIQGEPTRTFDTTSQGFNYSNLQILFDPYQNITLDIVLASGIVNIPKYHNEFPYQLLGFDTGYTLQARVRSVECDRGEAYNAQQGSCTPCPNGTYVLEFKGLCKEMEAGTMNASISNQISLKFGYWRPNHLNDLAELCKNKNYNCKGGYDVGNDLCIKGTVGALCEECDIYSSYWDESYSNSAKYECGTCQDNTTNIIMIVALSVWTMISTILSVKGNQERMELTILYDIIAMFGWSSSQQASSDVAVLMKILTSHLQILSILEGFQIAIPTGAIDTVNTVSMPAKTVGNSLDCFLVSNTWGIDLIYFRLIWSLIMQIIYVLAIMTIMLVAVLIGKLKFKIQYVYTMAIFLFLLLQPNYIMEFMLLISSRDISGLQWIQANVSYRYDTFKHDQWIAGFGIPGLTVWLIILPLIFLYVLYQGSVQGKLESFIFSQSWGFLYHEYRKKRYYWEFIKIFYRSLISVLIVYFQEEIVIKGILAFLVVYLYYILSNWLNPFQARTINDLDAFSTVTLALSLVLGVFLYRTIEIEILSLTYLGYLVIGIMNGLFLLIIAYILFQGYLKQFAPKLDEIREKILEKFPDLPVRFPRLKPYLVNHTKLNAKARKQWQRLARVVDLSLKKRKKDPSKPLVFLKQVQEEEVVDQNPLVNEALRQFYDDSQLIDGQQGQGLIEDQQQQSVEYNSQINALAEEGKENYQYQ